MPATRSPSRSARPAKLGNRAAERSIAGLVRAWDRSRGRRRLGAGRRGSATGNSSQSPRGSVQSSARSDQAAGSFGSSVVGRGCGSRTARARTDGASVAAEDRRVPAAGSADRSFTVREEAGGGTTERVRVPVSRGDRPGSPGRRIELGASAIGGRGSRGTARSVRDGLPPVESLRDPSPPRGVGFFGSRKDMPTSPGGGREPLARLAWVGPLAVQDSTGTRGCDPMARPASRRGRSLARRPVPVTRWAAEALRRGPRMRPVPAWALAAMMR